MDDSQANEHMSDETADRRGFLKRAGQTAAGLVAGGAAFLAGSEQAGAVQYSCCYLYHWPISESSCTSRCNGRRKDGYRITGWNCYTGWKKHFCGECQKGGRNCNDSRNSTYLCSFFRQSPHGGW